MDPAEPLLAPRPETTLPETFHAGEIRRLLESIDPTRPLGRRDKAILELFYAAGLRLSELCQLRLEMVDDEEGFIRVTGKGGKTRIARVGSVAREAMADYLRNERPSLVTLPVRS
jgi:site-specific recombinase XerD